MPKIRRKYGENTEGSTRVKLEPIRRLGGAPETPNCLDVGVHKPRTRRRRRRAQLPAPVQGLSRLTLHVGSHLCWLDVDPQRSPGVAAASAGGARRCSATRAHAERISCGPTPHRHGGGAACSHGRGRGRRGHPSGSPRPRTSSRSHQDLAACSLPARSALAAVSAAELELARAAGHPAEPRARSAAWKGHDRSSQLILRKKPPQKDELRCRA